jgi:hypothetical protein
MAEIETTNGVYILSVDSKEERDEWIDSITKASVSMALVTVTKSCCDGPMFALSFFNYRMGRKIEFSFYWGIIIKRLNFRFTSPCVLGQVLREAICI